MEDKIYTLINEALDQLPPGLKQCHDELKAHLYDVAQNQAKDLGMIGREEFDAQKAVLERTRKKIDLLEKEIQALKDQA